MYIHKVDVPSVFNVYYERVMVQLNPTGMGKWPTIFFLMCDAVISPKRHFHTNTNFSGLRFHFESVKVRNFLICEARCEFFQLAGHFGWQISVLKLLLLYYNRPSASTFDVQLLLLEVRYNFLS